MSTLFHSAAKAATEGPPAVLCILVSAIGSVPRRTGAKMLVWADGRTEGTIGGGAAEYEVTQRAMRLKPGDQPQIHSFELLPDNGMACGGSIQVYMEMIGPADRLFIFGAGHIGKELGKLALHYGFRVTMVDDREGIFSSEDQARYQCITASYPEVPESLGITENDYVAVMTYEHRLDIEITAIAANASPLYIGLIGSKNKLGIARQRFAEDFGLSDELINRIDMPIGVAIATETAAEIALAVMASIIDARNRHRGLKPKK